MNPSSRSLLVPAVDLRDSVVLLVDDDGVTAQVLAQTLGESGFQVVIASSGPQAKQRVMKQSPDVVVLDLKRSDMDSFELCRQLKMTPSLRSIPVVFLSDSGTVNDKVRAFRLGAVDYLIRPYAYDELLVRLEVHIRTGRKLREVEREKADLQRSNNELKKAQPKEQTILANPAELPGGFVIDGKFRLDGRIGLGGFGVVYKATQLQLQRSVAVKIFRPIGNLSSEEMLRRFRQEGTSASKLNHPNAVAMLDSGIAAGGIPYLAMELLIGRTLADELKEHPKLPLQRCMQIILPVCDVLIEAHAVGMVHRDIKPENVFLHRTRFGEVIKVLDFGIAKLVGGEPDPERPMVTGGGGILGTPSYMAPERLRHGPHDGRSDVYSVGVMLYQMLCGRLPFASDSQSFLEVVLNHLSQPAPPLRQYNPAIPEPVAALVMRTLEKEPLMRPTARELLTELVGVLRQAMGVPDFSANATTPMGTGSAPTAPPLVANHHQETAKDIAATSTSAKTHPDGEPTTSPLLILRTQPPPPPPTLPAPGTPLVEPHEPTDPIQLPPQVIAPSQQAQRPPPNERTSSDALPAVPKQPPSSSSSNNSLPTAVTMEVKLPPSGKRPG